MKKITLNKETDNFALSILSNVKVATAIVKCAAWYFYNFVLFIYSNLKDNNSIISDFSPWKPK